MKRGFHRDVELIGGFWYSWDHFSFLKFEVHCDFLLELVGYLMEQFLLSVDDLISKIEFVVVAVNGAKQLAENWMDI